MSPPTPFDRLAAACCIEPDYVDIWGRRHEIGEATKGALLEAMGVSAGSASAVRSSLQAVLARPFERLAPPVHVATSGQPITLPISVDAKAQGGLAWTFMAEEGDETSGEASLADLALIDRGKVGASKKIRRALTLPLQPEPGYHRCAVILDHGDRDPVETEIIVTPTRAFWPSCLDREGGLTGLTAPLYGLRSGRNAGLGDFADLAELAAITKPMGADFLGVNPVHALFPTQPHRISPYSPSSRLFLNTLFIALDQVPEFEQSEKARALLESAASVATLERLREADLVDYPAASTFKREVLEGLFASFRQLPALSPRRAAFNVFREAGGEALKRHARFEAIAEHELSTDPGKTDFRNWAEGLRSPDSDDVDAFARQHAERVDFSCYAQWLADEQLAAAQAQSKKNGMALGLYLDLAVGAAPDGAETWSDQEALVHGVRIGAPPDDFNPDGQDWGLLPLSPTALKARAYQPFIQLLRRNMRHAGALRIDHVLGLARSFWQPDGRGHGEGAPPGAYVRYPLDDLLGIVALESHRQQCVVIGEDLGTVPTHLREALDQRGLPGCRLLYFEREQDGRFRPAASYPKACITSTGTHDLPTFQGFWRARDVDVRERLGLINDTRQAAAEREARLETKKALLRLLADEGLLPDGLDPDHPPETPPWSLTLAFHHFFRITPAALNAVQLEDALGALDQANLPGTIDQYPNWRRKLALALEDLGSEASLRTLLSSPPTTLGEICTAD